MKRLRFIAMVAAAVLSASIFCACGGGGTSTKAEQTTEAKAESKSPKLKSAGGKSAGSKLEGLKPSGNKAKGGTKSFQPEADYTFFAAWDKENEILALAKDLDSKGTIKLEKGGTGSVELDGEGGDCTWELEDGYIYLYEGDEIVLGGAYEDGIFYAVYPEMEENMLFIFIQDGVDTSEMEAMATRM